MNISRESPILIIDEIPQHAWFLFNFFCIRAGIRISLTTAENSNPQSIHSDNMEYRILPLANKIEKNKLTATTLAKSIILWIGQPVKASHDDRD